MPELPEVETTRRGIAPHVEGQAVREVHIRDRRLRWPVTEGLEDALTGQRLLAVARRGKYLLLHAERGTLLVHLGMSGSLRLVTPDEAPRLHDHADLAFTGGMVLRFHDPRRFGCLLWVEDDPYTHPLLQSLGPEPLSDTFDGAYLFGASRKSAAPIKSFLMDSRRVVGVGNIYANEALFIAGVHPRRKAGNVGRERCERLVAAVKEVLAEAIRVGGTTLRDFVGGDGKPGYFSQSLRVYGRAGESCVQCGATLREVRLAQRSTVYCGRCQR